MLILILYQSIISWHKRQDKNRYGGVVLDRETRSKIRAARNAYAREWRKKNPERAKAINERYWARRAERLAAAEREEAEHGQGQDDQ